MPYECNEKTAEAKAQAYGPDQLPLFKTNARNRHTSRTQYQYYSAGFMIVCSRQGLCSPSYPFPSMHHYSSFTTTVGPPNQKG